MRLFNRKPKGPDCMVNGIRYTIIDGPYGNGEYNRYDAVDPWGNIATVYVDKEHRWHAEDIVPKRMIKRIRRNHPEIAEMYDTDVGPTYRTPKGIAVEDGRKRYFDKPLMVRTEWFQKAPDGTYTDVARKMKVMDNSDLQEYIDRHYHGDIKADGSVFPEMARPAVFREYDARRHLWIVHTVGYAEDMDDFFEAPARFAGSPKGGPKGGRRR